MFKDFFKQNENEKEDISFVIETSKDNISTQNNLQKIRDSGIKIKTIIPTKFGFEITFFNKFDAQKAAKIIDTDKIDGTSIFMEK